MIKIKKVSKSPNPNPSIISFLLLLRLIISLRYAPTEQQDSYLAPDSI